MIVLFCHIPFIFFSAKEGLLIIIDELDRRSISKTLDQRLEELRESSAPNFQIDKKATSPANNDGKTVELDGTD
jgi:hypothetical protein